VLLREVAAQPTGEVPTLTTAITVSAARASRFDIPVHLGKLAAGRKMVIPIEARNPLNADFEIQSLGTMCDCVKLEISQRRFEANCSIFGKLKLEVSSQSKSTKRSERVVLKTTTTQNAMVVTFEIDGLCCFAERSYLGTADVGATEFRFSLPAIISESYGLEDIEVDFGGDFKGASFQIERTAREQCKVDVRVQYDEPTGFGIGGLISMRPKGAASSAEVYCTIDRSQPVTIASSLIRFHQSYSARCMAGHGDFEGELRQIGSDESQ
jgi:hypothetical protein